MLGRGDSRRPLVEAPCPPHRSRPERRGPARYPGFASASGIEFLHCSSAAPNELEFLSVKPTKVFLTDPAFGKQTAEHAREHRVAIVILPLELKLKATLGCADRCLTGNI